TEPGANVREGGFDSFAADEHELGAVERLEVFARILAVQDEVRRRAFSERNVTEPFAGRPGAACEGCRRGKSEFGNLKDLVWDRHLGKAIGAGEDADPQ